MQRFTPRNNFWYSRTNESTVYKFTKNIRSMIKAHFDNTPILLDGNGIVIQIDESKFNLNVKSHTVHVSDVAFWVFRILNTSL